MKIPAFFDWRHEYPALFADPARADVADVHFHKR
jgi:hypothetical protein